MSSKSLRHFTLIALALVAFVLVFASSGALASHPEVSLPGSNFEIDQDANTQQDDPTPSIDWLTANTSNPVTVVNDKPSGQNDDSFGQGSKEDTAEPTVVDGSIPPNKSDLLEFGVYVEEEVGGAGFLHLFWSRVQDPSGTTNMDFEFNQNKCVTDENGTPTADSLCANNGSNQSPLYVTPVREPGDLLITYDLANGGTNAQLALRVWNGTQWGPEQDLDASNLAAGSINDPSSVPQGTTVNGDILGPYGPRTFGEASIDLDAIFNSDACESFGSAYLKSRSSDSFTAAMKDFIAPEPVNITNCGSVTIRKETLPDEDPNETLFNYSTNVETDPASDPNFSLMDDGAITFNNVLFGTGYTVMEADPADAGYELDHIDCSASSGATPIVDEATRTVTFDIDDAADNVDCTFYNRALGSITIVKDAVPDDAQDFSFTGTGPDGYDFDSGFALDDDADATLPNSMTFPALPTGDYTVTEAGVSGWDLTDITCSDGSSTDLVSMTASISLAAGEDVTCTYTNVKRAALIVEKQTNPDGAPGTFDFTGDAVGSIGDGGQIIVPDLPAGTYTATEADPTSIGYRLDSIVCDDANSTGDLATRTATFVLEPGEIVTCVFTNSTGAIEVTKTRKHAADGIGIDHPHAGVDFTVDGVTLVTGADGKVCFDGLVPGTEYSVTESVPAGYTVSPSATQNVVVSAGATCDLGTADAVSFSNIPLTNITVSVDSQVDGGTSSTIDCVLDSASTDATGDGSLLLPDLEPGTYTCTIVVDP